MTGRDLRGGYISAALAASSPPPFFLLEVTMVDWTKPIRVRNGHPAELIHTLTNSPWPRVVKITDPRDEGQFIGQYREDGRARHDESLSPSDIVNVGSAEADQFFFDGDTLISPSGMRLSPKEVAAKLNELYAEIRRRRT